MLLGILWLTYVFKNFETFGTFGSVFLPHLPMCSREGTCLGPYWGSYCTYSAGI